MRGSLSFAMFDNSPLLLVRSARSHAPVISHDQPCGSRGGRLAVAKVTDRLAAVDYAHVLKELSDTRFPDAEKIVLVQDHLSRHTPAALYEAFPADEARRRVERFEWHDTPKHGNRFNLAEIRTGRRQANWHYTGRPRQAQVALPLVLTGSGD